MADSPFSGAAFPGFPACVPPAGRDL